MKYKVIGWTFYDNSEILDSGSSIGFAERNAIIDEIIKHKYMFSGWHHQESWDGVVPILNDGRKRCFSQRGWGGVMAEAYGHMGMYDYSSFTFHESIPRNKLRFAPDDFDVNMYQPKAVENEHFDVCVNEGLFEIAKSNNPFYLEDLKELRYIDKNDTITLYCNDQKLSFVVKDIDRNKTDINLKNAKDLINSEYKIIVTTKPESEREISKPNYIISKSQAFEVFKEVMDEYNYDIIKEVIELFDVHYLARNLKRKDNIKNLTRFINEYSNASYRNNSLLELLRYVNNFELFKDIANKTLENNKYIYIEFINHYLDKGKNMDEYILKFSDLVDVKNLYVGSIDILFKAITIDVNNISLRKKYYKAIKNTNHEGLAIMAGCNLYKYLRKDDLKFIELENYKKYSDSTILNIVEYLTYPKECVTDKTYPYYLPKIYELKEKVIDDGVKAYQNYIRKHFDIDLILEDMMLVGIDKKCYEMDQYMCGEEHAAKYVHTLDLLTDYKYNLKNKALEKYKEIYSKFEAEVEYIYNKNKME